MMKLNNTIILDFPEPLSLTAQTLIARDSHNPEKVKQMSIFLLQFGCLCGAGLALTYFGILKLFPQFFSSNISVIKSI